MKTWHTFGACGETVVELGWLDLIKLLCRRTLSVKGSSVAISLGRSDRQPLKASPSREEQLSPWTVDRDGRIRTNKDRKVALRAGVRGDWMSV
jgi:hypothetical protein